MTLFKWLQMMVTSSALMFLTNKETLNNISIHIQPTKDDRKALPQSVKSVLYGDISVLPSGQQWQHTEPSQCTGCIFQMHLQTVTPNWHSEEFNTGRILLRSLLFIMLQSLHWQLVADVSRAPIGSNFKGQVLDL
jgi:hypothetical protein